MAANKKKNPDAIGAVRNQTIAVVAALLLVAGAMVGGWYYYNNTIGKDPTGPSESTLPQVDTEVNMGPPAPSSRSPRAPTLPPSLAA